MSADMVVVGICCDFPGCRARTNQFVSFDQPTAPGWETWVGSRRRMDYCPEHAARPKAKTMRKVWPK